jgi:signal transduction histidine kinase/Tfp pilus assembly protein PilF
MFNCGLLIAQQLQIDSLVMVLDKQLPDTQKIDVYNNLSYNYSFIDVNKGVEYGLLARDLAKKINDSTRFGSALVNLGVNFHAMDNKDSAVVLYESALQYFRSTNARKGQIDALNNLANIYDDFGQASKALTYYNSALDVARELSLPEKESMCLLNIGVFHHRRREYDKALSYYNRSMDIDEAIGNYAALSTTYNNIALVYKTQGDLPNRIVYLMKGADLARQQGNTSSLALNLLNLAIAYRDMGQERQAMLNIELARQNYLQSGNWEGYRKASYAQALIYFKFDHYEDAHIIIGDLKADSLSGKNMWLDYDILDLESDIYAAMGDYRSALKMADAADKLEDSLYDISKIDIIKQLELDREQAENQTLLLQSKLDDEQLEVQRERISRQRSIIALSFLLIVVVSIAFFIVWRGRRQRSQLIEDLSHKNVEIERLNGELFEKLNELENAFDRLEKTKQQLVNSEKAAALGVLAAGVGHEINNPLNFIQKGWELISNKLGAQIIKNFGVEHDLLIIEEGIKRIDSITTSLAAIVDTSEDTKKFVDLYSIVLNCVNAVRVYQRVNQSIVINSNSEVIEVFGNEGQLHQVLFGVLKNAVEASNANSKVAVTLENDADFVKVIIKDAGSGMEKNVLLKAIDPFFTTKSHQGGVGLGLYISQEVVKNHGGRITIDSEVDVGTSVTIKLPKAEKAIVEV